MQCSLFTGPSAMPRIPVVLLAAVALCARVGVSRIALPRPAPVSRDLDAVDAYELYKMSIMAGWRWDDSGKYKASIAAPGPLFQGFMGSLDYGGQPPNYNTGGLPRGFPVDQREGSPVPLHLRQRPAAPAAPAASAAQFDQHRPQPAAQGAQQAQKENRQGLFKRLWHGAVNVAKATNRVVTKAADNIKQRASWLFG